MSAKAAIRSTSTEATGFQATEIGLIPSDWEVVSAGDLGRFRGGNGFPVSYQGRSEGQFPFFKVSDMNIAGNEIWMVSANNYLSERDRQRLGSYVFPRETIIFAKVGAAIFLERKKLLNSPSCIDNNMAGFMVESSQIDRNYIYHQFVNYRLSGLVSTTALPSLNGAVLKSIKFAKPQTLVEQEAIANALSDADALIESLERLIAKKRAIKQGAMKELLSGRRRLKGFKEQWEAKRIGEFTDATAGGTPSTLKSEYWGGDVRWMSSGELHSKQVYEVEGRITASGLANSAAKMLPVNCILVGLAGQGKTRGTAAINRVPLSTNQSIGAILPSPMFLPDFLFHCIDSRYDELRELSSGDGGRGGLNLTIIKSLNVALPPIKEQQAIAAVLNDIDAEIVQNSMRLAKAQQLKQGMMQDLLTGRARLL